MPVIGIAFILVALIRRQRAAPGGPLLSLTVVTAIWLLITLAYRLALSAPARNYFISAAIRDYAASHRESFYFGLTQWFWTAEQIIVLLFGVLLFVVLSRETANTSNQSLQPTAGREENYKGEIRK
jgi:hypothetical protein